MEQGYGIKCEPDTPFQLDYLPHPSNDVDQSPEGALDMDLTGFLDMEDTTLSELPVSPSGWTSLFNGQLDELDTLDPTTGMHAAMAMNGGMGPNAHTPSAPGHGHPGVAKSPSMDQWLVEETHKLERQQKLQQQKLLELQQTLIKTEILKNQLQIATISQSPSTPSPPPSSLLASLTGNGGGSSFNFTPSVTTSRAATESSGTPKVPIQKNVQATVIPASRTAAGGGACPRMSTSSSKMQPPFSPVFEPDKRKVHNLIEKKYRSSINDRICLLRDMVSKDGGVKDNKRLQKSAVLQKTIDYIRHIESHNRRLQEENKQLRAELAKATGQSGYRLLSFSSPPSTPHQFSISPRSLESGEDSGQPSSPDEYLSDEQAHDLSPRSVQGRGGRLSVLASHLMLRHDQTPHISRRVLCVLLLAVFFINPLSLFLPRGDAGVSHQMGGVRSLSGFDDETPQPRYVADSVVYLLLWALKLLIAAGVFGWMTLCSFPTVPPNSKGAVQFWRYKVQAENDMQKGEFSSARKNLESALEVLGQPIPTSTFGIVTGLLWNVLSHLMFQLLVGRVAVALVSIFVRPRGAREAAGKKESFEVTCAHISETYHLLQQINMATPGGTHLNGLGFYLGLSALNFAEADRPMRLLTKQQLSEMYFTLGLQSHFSIPYGANLAMWYYFLCARISGKCATPLEWSTTPRGKKFLLSSQWAAEVRLGSRLYKGAAALPLYATTRAYCKHLLRDGFATLLILPDSPSTESHDPKGDFALKAFKDVLNLAKEANSSLLQCHSDMTSVTAAADVHDSGFAVIQWWASVGLVACYWATGENPSAEDYYANIEALSGDSAPVPTALHLAFKANRLQRRPSESEPASVEVLLQLCSLTSNSLKTCVTDVLQDHTNSTENELHQLGLLLACQWLLDLRVKVWEDHGKEGGVTREISQGFYQDLDTLSQLVTLLPLAISRLRLYKGYYQLIAGANPMQAERMLSLGGGSLLLRRRGQKPSDQVTSKLLRYQLTTESQGDKPVAVIAEDTPA